MRKLCINCHDEYNDSKGKNLVGYCWYCREVKFGTPDDSWLPLIDLDELIDIHIKKPRFISIKKKDN